MKLFTKTVVASLVTLACHANAEVTIKEFSAGDYIKAADMNTNFANLKAGVDLSEKQAEELSNELEALTVDIQAIIASIEDSGEDLDTEIAAIYESLNTLSIASSSNTDQIGVNTTNIAKNTTSITSLQLSVAQVQETILALDVLQQADESKFEGVYSRLDTIESQLSSLSQLANENTESINGLTAEITSLNETVTANTQLLSEQGEQLSNLGTADEELQSLVTSLQETTDSQAESIASNTMEVEGLQLSQQELVTAVEVNRVSAADNASRLNNVEITVSNNADSISTNSLGISDNSELLQQQASELGSLDQSHQQLTVSVNANTDTTANNAISITANTNAISDNSVSTLANSEGISSNALLIQDNISAIASMDSRLTTGLDEIGSTTSAVDANTVTINENTLAIAGQATQISDIDTRLANTELLTDSFRNDIGLNRTDIDYLLSFHPKSSAQSFSIQSSDSALDSASYSDSKDLALVTLQSQDTSSYEVMEQSSDDEPTHTHQRSVYSEDNQVLIGSVLDQSINGIIVSTSDGYIFTLKRLFSDVQNIDPILAMKHADDWTISSAIPQTRMDLPVYYIDSSCSSPLVHESFAQYKSEGNYVAGYDSENGSFVVTQGTSSASIYYTVFSYETDVNGNTQCVQVDIPGLPFVQAELVPTLSNFNTEVITDGTSDYVKVLSNILIY